MGARLSCVICHKPGEHDFIGHAAFCPEHYRIWAEAEANARLVVGMDKDLESDERLIAAKKALEDTRNALKSAQERLHQLEYGY